MPVFPQRTALLLSSGGVRGAYQVGVLDGIVDVLGVRGVAGPPLFDIFTGASIGAINASFLAANATRTDHAIDDLVRVWTSLVPREIMPFTPLGLWGWPRRPWLPRPRDTDDPSRGSPYVGRSLFDPRPLERLLADIIDWDRLHANLRGDVVRALMIAALDVCDSRTTLFAELAPGAAFAPYPSTAPRTDVTEIDAGRVLASSALPFIFPARNVDGRYYMDGAIRFTAPTIPALRAGAERLVVISLLRPAPPTWRRSPEYPGVVFLLGKLLSALLLDPLGHDLDDLRRNNRILATLDAVLAPEARAALLRDLVEDRALPSRIVPTLVFEPSADLSALTAAFIRDELGRSRLHSLSRALLGRLGRAEGSDQALLASILLLDGRLAARLIDLGRRDAHAARDRILAFFAGDAGER